VSLPAIDQLGARELARLAEALEGSTPLVFAIPATAIVAGRLTRNLEQLGLKVSSVESSPVLYPDLSELAETILSGPVTSSLVDALWTESNALVGRAVATLRTWTSAGRVVATSSGLEVLEPIAGSDLGAEVGTIIRSVLEQLTPIEMQTLQLVALMDLSVTPETLLPVLTTMGGVLSDAGEVRQLLEKLVEMGVLRFSPEGYQFRHPHMRDAAESWARPTVRRALHRQIAESGIVDAASSARHWMKAGEPRIACDKAIEAADMATLNGGPTENHLAQATVFAEALAPNPSEHSAMLEQLGDKAHELRLFRQARQCYLSALASAQLGGLVTAPRLRGKIHSTSTHNAETLSLKANPEPVPVLDVVAARGWGQRLEEALEAMGDLEPGRTLEIRFSPADSSGPRGWTRESNGSGNVVRLARLSRAPGAVCTELIEDMS
jgi:hypothetical protein